MLKFLARFFCKHEFENLSFKRNGKMTLSWDVRIVPEYDAVDQCKKCGKIVRDKFISLAD
jgi:hypothetical protein